MKSTKETQTIILRRRQIEHDNRLMREVNGEDYAEIRQRTYDHDLWVNLTRNRITKTEDLINQNQAEYEKLGQELEKLQK